MLQKYFEQLMIDFLKDEEDKEENEKKEDKIDKENKKSKAEARMKENALKLVHHS